MACRREIFACVLRYSPSQPHGVYLTPLGDSTGPKGPGIDAGALTRARHTARCRAVIVAGRYLFKTV